MKNKITIIAVILIIAACIVGKFSTIPAVDYGAIAVEAFGFTLLIVKTLKKAETKTWKEYTAVILFAGSGVCCALAGVAESTMTQLIELVFGLIAFIIGMLSVKNVPENT